MINSRQNYLNAKRFTADLALEHIIPHNVCFYLIPPIVDLTIEEFEKLALERLKMLRLLEQVAAKNPKATTEAWREAVLAEVNHDGLRMYAKLFRGNINDDATKIARRRDYLSHFILRFAYCRSDELRRWFVAREMELFRLKFSALSARDIKEFLEVYELDYSPLADAEKAEISEQLCMSTSNQTRLKVETSDFYAVHFTEVLNLVRDRKCFLKGGKAYIPPESFVHVVARKHQQLIEDGLKAHLLMLPTLESDERFSMLLKSIHTSYTGKNYTVAKTGIVPIESVDQLSKKSFPLCMRHVHDTLRATHHLKHVGRMQYTLFLKAIGVTVDDCLRFWREELTRGKVAIDKFEKDYAYNIRHNYGKEGSRINYAPHSCMKVITAPIGPGETHGCPFKNMDASALKVKLSGFGLSALDCDEVAGYAAKGHYQIACGKYFEALHETKLEEGINHPNQYFELSQLTMEGRNTTERSRARAPQQQPPRLTGGSQSTSQAALHDSSLLADYSTLNGADDDQELWEIMETKDKESEGIDRKLISSVSNSKHTQASPAKLTAKDWDDEDFDLLELNE
ncbi:DNA primase large subunit-like [Anopheles albimanus]|uniref:DNA primase large subunit n=1 Tax=Anopheles albimanus TaxID=7167 RepID=A0A182FEL1_ANOAL|nr:DNA primase large subunit-like [Anopheles albimanus]